ncbi:MAG: peptidoglycan editing factor PgeF [Clostridia bacterium]|nr:peptidoglycan editing factor PgeF [Clostridia bacterium]
MNLTNDNVIHVKKDGIEYLQFRKLLEYKDIINHAYSLGINYNYRTDKSNKKPLPREEFEKNCKDYESLCNAMGENCINVVKCNQEHTKNVKLVNSKINPNEPDFNLSEYDATDGLVTNKSNFILATTNADCILLLFFDPVKKVIANVHSGWKGTLQRISVEAVKKMVKEYNCNPQDIICCICPSIRKCHFEVDKDVKDLFEKEFKELNSFIEYNEKKEKWNIDTVLINKEILKKEGLKEENIIDSGLCSVCNSKIIHSFRVEKEGYGLNTALISLK